MSLRNKLIGLPSSGLRIVLNNSSSAAGVSISTPHLNPSRVYNATSLPEHIRRSYGSGNGMMFARSYCSSDNKNNKDDDAATKHYKSFTNNDSNSGEQETHGQALHSFGSSQTLEQASNRFDAQVNQNPPRHDYQMDLASEHAADVFNSAPSVSMKAHMQSQVPYPYGGSPTHMNMPGGTRHREDKYVQGRLSDASKVPHSREYSTSAFVTSVDEHGNLTYDTSNIDSILREPCPQGIQGEDCAAFKLWLTNCLVHGNHEDCQKLANEYIAGRKTLGQVFAEYDMIIASVARASGQSQVGTEHLLMFSSPTGPSGAGRTDQTAGGSPDSSPDDDKKESAKSTRIARLKAAVRDYGSTVVVFHVGISLASLGFFYTLVASNVDVSSILNFFSIDLGAAQTAAGTASTFAVAYAVHKVFAPVRIGTTLTCAPLIVKSLRARGILKTPPPPPK